MLKYCNNVEIIDVLQTSRLQQTKNQEMFLDVLEMSLGEKLQWTMNQEMSLDEKLQQTKNQEMSLDEMLQWTMNQEMSLDEMLLWTKNQEMSLDEKLQWTKNQEMSLDEKLQQTKNRGMSLDEKLQWTKTQEMYLDVLELSLGDKRQLMMEKPQLIQAPGTIEQSKQKCLYMNKETLFWNVGEKLYLHEQET